MTADHRRFEVEFGDGTTVMLTVLLVKVHVTRKKSPASTKISSLTQRHRAAQGRLSQ